METHIPLDPRQFAHLRVGTMMRSPFTRICTISGCDGEMRAMGLCSVHYERSRLGRPVDVVIVRRKRRS